MASSNLSDKSTSNSTDIQYAASTGTFLVLFILAGTIGNGLIIVSIISSKKLRTSSLHLLALNVAAVNVLECLLNMTFNLTSILSVDTLKEVDTICRVNAFFINVIWIESILGITFMVVERMVAMKNTDKIDVFQRPGRIAIMVAYTWIHSVAFSLPLTTGLVPVSIYSDINSCLISQKSSAVYIGTLSMCCLVVPIVVTVILFIITMKNAFTEKSVVQAQMTRHQYSNDVNEPNFFKEFAGAKFSGILLVSWFFLVGPFVVAIFINLYQYSDMNLDSGLKLSHSSIVYFLLLWLKYCNVFILPMFSLCYKKEFWLNFKDVLFCKKKNSVNDVANEQNGLNRLSVESQDKIEKLEAGEKKRKEEKMKEAFIHNSGFQVPVLFATAKGVHIQTSESEVVVDDQGTVGKKCDVLGSQDQLPQLEDDTSDYDSGNELDPFSVSHPVSSKNIRNHTPTLQHRSNSQPEVRAKERSTERPPSVTVTSAADSGLDISTNRGGFHHSSPTLAYDRSVSCPDGETNVPNRTQTHNHSHITSRHGGAGIHEPEIFAHPGCENHAYEEDTGDVDRCNKSVGQNESDQADRQITENVANAQRLNHSKVCEKDNGADSGFAPSSQMNYDEGRNYNKGPIDDRSMEIETKAPEVVPAATDVVPATPSKKKKRHKNKTKSYTGILRNGSEEMSSPPRPPPRLAPLQGCHQALYQRMTEETENVTEDEANLNINIGSEAPVTVSNKAAVYEVVKRDKKMKNKTKQRNADSETLLLDSGSSAELKCLKDSMFGATESERYSPPVLEVTTPSACKLMDLSKDFENVTPSQTPDPHEVQA